jgi:CubicO group peptidase (beta-lactamase class C family)
MGATGRHGVYMVPIRFTRRRFALLCAAALVAPARVRARTFEAVRDRARALDQLHAVVVAVDGQVVLAESFRGAGLDRPANVKSVSKTLVATLTGAAIARGHLPGVEAPVLQWLAPRAPRGMDPRAEAITVEDLLTMRSGFERTSGANYGAWVSSRDWVGYVLSQPMVAAPGTRFGYSTGDYHLLGAVLAAATGRSLHSLARDWIGAPLGVEIPPWIRDPQGLFLGGNEMALSPRAMLDFGEAIRRGGGALVDADWIAASWRPRTRSPFSGHEYGYGWFLASLGGERVAYARGYGGQMIYVAPEARVTVAITSDPGRPARSQGHAGDLHALVAETVFPAVRDS